MAMKIKENPVVSSFGKVRGCIQKIDHKVIHVAHHGMHMSYLGAVTYEAHGLYSYCAGGLLAVVIVSLLAGAGE